MTTALIDYGVGNLHSAHKALDLMARAGDHGEVVVTRDPQVVAKADRIVLPGDGAFPHCARALAAIEGLPEALTEAAANVPFLGICVGMQLLATTASEFEETAGLNLIPGRVQAIDAPGLKVPHMGWNDLVVERPHALARDISDGDHAYFVHSYAFTPDAPAHRLAYCVYGREVTAMLVRDNIAGMQFHPEKSQQTGLRLLANFLAWRP